MRNRIKGVKVCDTKHFKETSKIFFSRLKKGDIVEVPVSHNRYFIQAFGLKKEISESEAYRIPPELLVIE